MIFLRWTFFINFFFIMTTDNNSAEIEITQNICWFRYWAAVCNGPHVLGNWPHC